MKRTKSQSAWNKIKHVQLVETHRTNWYFNELFVWYARGIEMTTLVRQQPHRQNTYISMHSFIYSFISSFDTYAYFSIFGVFFSLLFLKKKHSVRRKLFLKQLFYFVLFIQKTNAWCYKKWNFLVNTCISKNNNSDFIDSRTYFQTMASM